MHLIIFYTTLPDQKSADLLIEELLNEKLIACANSHEIQSNYSWKGDKYREQEISVKLKTLPHLIELCEKRISEVHPYEVPCIYWSKVRCAESYLNWVKDQIK